MLGFRPLCTPHLTAPHTACSPTTATRPLYPPNTHPTSSLTIGCALSSREVGPTASPPFLRPTRSHADPSAAKQLSMEEAEEMLREMMEEARAGSPPPPPRLSSEVPPAALGADSSSPGIAPAGAGADVSASGAQVVTLGDNIVAQAAAAANGGVGARSDGGAGTLSFPALSAHAHAHAEALAAAGPDSPAASGAPGGLESKLSSPAAGAVAPAGVRAHSEMVALKSARSASPPPGANGMQRLYSMQHTGPSPGITREVVSWGAGLAACGCPWDVAGALRAARGWVAACSVRRCTPSNAHLPAHTSLPLPPRPFPPPAQFKDLMMRNSRNTGNNPSLDLSSGGAPGLGRAPSSTASSYALSPRPSSTPMNGASPLAADGSNGSNGSADLATSPRAGGDAPRTSLPTRLPAIGEGLPHSSSHAALSKLEEEAKASLASTAAAPCDVVVDVK